ncbi:MAG: AzlC family ABC transporter permease [Actinomycetota bacterium]|nr:AzlC family ABC transporter permease [Actinomycetota bacterium]
MPQGGRRAWAIGYRADGRWDRRSIFGAGFLLLIAWVAETLLGALGGQMLEDSTRGLWEWQRPG